MVLIGIDPYPYIISAGVVHCATSRAIEKLSAHDIAVTKQASDYPSSYSHLLARCELATFCAHPLPHCFLVYSQFLLFKSSFKFLLDIPENMLLKPYPICIDIYIYIIFIHVYIYIDVEILKQNCSPNTLGL